MRPAPRQHWALVAWLALAVLLHGLGIWAGAERLHRGRLASKKPEYRLVQLMPTRPRIGSPPRLKEAKRLPTLPVRELMPEGQIVDIAPSADSRPPDQAKLLAEHNSRVERESRSRNARPDFSRVRSQAAERRTEAVATRPPSAGGSGGKDPGSRQVAPSAAQDQLHLQLDPELGSVRRRMASLGAGGTDAKTHLSDDSLGQGSGLPADGEGGRATEAPPSAPIALMPSLGSLMQMDGGPMNDQLKDVDVGEGTFLNAREFKYAAFFNRIKRDVAQEWRPMEEYKRRDPTGNVLGLKGRSTLVQITLDRDGDLVDAAVANSSGVPFLDEEALGAFRRAQPFPNPPRGLLDTAGRIVFSFGFHVEVTPSGLFGGP